MTERAQSSKDITKPKANFNFNFGGIAEDTKDDKQSEDSHST